MRSALPLLLLLAACDKATPAGASGDETIACTLGKAAPAQCRVERLEDHVLIVHHPDGGFRRLAIADDGRGIVAADGAEIATVRIVDDKLIDVAIGEDSYRLPATVKPRAK